MITKEQACITILSGSQGSSHHPRDGGDGDGHGGGDGGRHGGGGGDAHHAAAGSRMAAARR